MAQDTPSRKLDQYIVRFPDGMRERLKLEASRNGRSLNAEIIQRLFTTLEMDDYQPGENVNPDEASDELSRIREIIDRLPDYLKNVERKLDLVLTRHERKPHKKD